jgi:hypothetical protein
MEYLIQFLLSNIIPIIIVVSIVLRIYGGMKNAANSRRRKAAQAQSPARLQEQKAPDEDETAPEEDWESDDDDIRPRFYTAESAPPRQTLPPPPPLVPLPEIKPLDSAASRPIFEAAAPDPLDTFQAAARPALRQLAASPAESASSAFLCRISALRPMQQALVMSEILGPPRGLNPL